MRNRDSAPGSWSQRIIWRIHSSASLTLARRTSGQMAVASWLNRRGTPDEFSPVRRGHSAEALPPDCPRARRECVASRRSPSCSAPSPIVRGTPRAYTPVKPVGSGEWPLPDCRRARLECGFFIGACQPTHETRRQPGETYSMATAAGNGRRASRAFT